MMFEKRHYEALAKALARSHVHNREECEITTLLNLCSMLKADNPRFDVEWFLEAAKYDVAKLNECCVLSNIEKPLPFAKIVEVDARQCCCFLAPQED